MSKINWQEIHDWQDIHKDQLIMVADPRTDGISISFGGLNTFVKFPSTDMADGVVFNALRESKFNDVIDILMSGIMESTGIKDKGKGGELLKELGGSIKSIGNVKEEERKEKLKDFKKVNKNHGKSIKNKN